MRIETDHTISVCYSPKAQALLNRMLRILHQLQNLNNNFFLSDIETLAEKEREIWLHFNEPLFSQGLAWLECQSEKVYLFTRLNELFRTPSPSQSTLSPICALYFSQGNWQLHHTERNWVYISKKTPQELSVLTPLSEKLGFFEDSSKSAHVVEDLFQQYSSLKNENPILDKYREDNIDDFPLLHEMTSLERAQDEWQKSWNEIRVKRHSSEETNNKELNISHIGRLLDLAFSIHSKENGRYRRGYPSAGGFYAECLLVEINRVKGIEAGVYLYHPLKHQFFFIDNQTCSNKSISFIIASRIELLRRRYNKISTRLMLLNTGVMMHQLSLACALMEINGHPHGTQQQFPWDKKINHIWPSDWRISGRFIIN